MQTISGISRRRRRSRPTVGFTIVELLIVVVIIAILAAITVVAFNGVQQRAQNSQRQYDLAAVAKGLEMYYTDNGHYPTIGQCISSPWWNCWGAGGSTSSLLPTQYMSKMPQDPTFVDNAACGLPNGYNTRAYGYVNNADGSGYVLAAYIPGLPTSDPHYYNGSPDFGCLDYANYLIRRNM